MNRKELRLLISAHNATRAAFQAVAADLKHIQKELHQTGVEAERSLGRAKSALGGLMGMVGGGGGFSLAGLGGVIGGLGVGAMVAGFTKMGIEANTFRENVMASLTAMLKNKQAASGLFEEFSRFADVTPFDDEPVVKAGQALMTFGFNAMKYLPLVGDTAAAMKVDLLQVVGVLAKLKAGQFDIAEMGPVGISREGLQKFGARFNRSGEPTNRRALLPAGEALLKEKFGGTMSGAATGFDATSSTMLANIRRVARGATEVLFGSLKPAFTAVSAELEKVLANGKLMSSLKVIFDGVGHAIGLAAAQLPKLFQWLERIAKADGIRELLSNVIAFGMTLGQTFAQLAGIDLAKIFDPQNVHGWFEEFGVGIANVVNGVFGMARVWEELKVILNSFWVDTRDAVTDFAQDTVHSFKFAFAELQLSIAQAAGGILSTIKVLLDAINEIHVELWDGSKFKPFKLDTAGLDAAKLAQEFAAAAAEANIGGILDEHVQRFRQRGQRDMIDKPKADRFRNDSFGQRIGDAFNGIDRDTSAQDAFWARFEKNRRRVQEAMFPKPVTGPDIPPPPQMFGLDPKRPATVNGVAAGSGGLDPQALELLGEQVELLKEHASMWGVVVDAAKAYADTLGDHGKATRGVLTALGGQLNALNQLKAGQQQLLANQPLWSKEWLQGLGAINATAKEILGIKNAVRDLLFDTAKLKEASGVFADVFAIGKDVGFGPEQMQAIAAQQQALMLQTLEVERARLGTLEKGTAEWFKQQRTVIGTVASILKLKKELSEANGMVDQQQLRGFARTPFGIRGAGAEPGAMRQQSDLAREAQRLLGYALNPRSVNLDQEAQRVMGGGVPAGGVANPNGAANPGAAATNNINVRGGDIYVQATDFQAIRRQVIAEVDARLGQVFQMINGRQQDRAGGR